MDISRSHVLYRSFNGDMLKMVAGMEELLYDHNGNRYIDMSSSACQAILGHSNKWVRDCIKRQLDTIPNVFGGFWASNAAEHAAELLASELKSWFSRVHFVNGGGEAVDLACKLAYQYHAEMSKPRSSFVALHCGYHGVGTLPFTLTGDYPRYKLIQPYHDRMLQDGWVCHIEHPYTCSDEESLRQMREAVTNWNPIAVILEPVTGPPLGAYVHSQSYLEGVRKICNDTGTLLILDEILCGSGRCGGMAVCDRHNVEPDILLLGKGLSAGYVPMSAICLSHKVVDCIARGSGSIMFGTANSNHTLGCAAIAGTIEYFKDQNLYHRVRDKNQYLLELILHNLTRHGMQYFGLTVRSMGFLVGIDLVNSNYGSTLPAELQFHTIVRKAILDEGVVVYTKGQTVDGLGDFITIAPPADAHETMLEKGIEGIAKGLLKAYQ